VFEIPVASVKVQRKLSSDSLISFLGYVLGCFPLQISLVVTVSMMILYTLVHHNGVIHRTGWLKIEEEYIETQIN
jgi:hypothetical protein